MATCEVTPDNNLIDYVCGKKSKGGTLVHGRAQPDYVNGMPIHYYPQAQTLTVRGSNPYDFEQALPNNQAINIRLPPLVVLVESYQNKVLREFEKLIKQIEAENARLEES